MALITASVDSMNRYVQLTSASERDGLCARMPYIAVYIIIDPLLSGHVSTAAFPGMAEGVHML
jgi:hypothetical protein